MSKYTEHTVSSGATVAIRPRTYPEWEEQENARLAVLEGLPEKVEAGNVQRVEVTLQRANMTIRNARFVSWVENFDQVKSTLTMRDIAEIENIALELEAVEIPLGNLADGGNGLLTPNDTPTVKNAEKGTAKGKK